MILREYNIQLIAPNRPTVHTLRNVPLAFFKRTETWTVWIGWIKNCRKGWRAYQMSSPWVQRKDNALHQNLPDTPPPNLNLFTRRKHFPIPMREEVLSELVSAKYFTTLDDICGFWQMPLGKCNAWLFMFSTLFGRYSLKNPFGLIYFPEVFLRKVNGGSSRTYCQVRLQPQALKSANKAPGKFC